jgi:uncharacterized membrane protein YhiD involved in acid resistance
MDGLAHAWPQLVVLAEVPAAMLLFSGAIGVCAALQQWWLAVGATPLALLVLRGLQAFEARIEAKAGPNGN